MTDCDVMRAQKKATSRAKRLTAIVRAIRAAKTEDDAVALLDQLMRREWNAGCQRAVLD